MLPILDTLRNRPQILARLLAEGINPDVQLEAFHMNITTLEGFQVRHKTMLFPVLSQLKYLMCMSWPTLVARLSTSVRSNLFPDF